MLNDVSKILVQKECTIRQILQTIDNGTKGIVIVVNDENKLLGTITDGDVRRALLSGASLNDKIDNIIHLNPVFIYESTPKEEVKDIFIRKAIKDIPIVNNDNVVVDIISINDLLLTKGKENPVVIMAGGLGSRLKDLTKEIPKPMLKIGDKPILQHVINNFAQYGFNKILVSVNYKAEIIENYFQDGYAYGVKINYIRENKRMGTAGGIRLAKDYIDKDFFVINADIFTNLNMENMMEFHEKNSFDITVGIRKFSYQIPYGVLKLEGNYVKGLVEKPITDYYINGGIYCLNPKVIEFIPMDQYFEITELIQMCINNGLRVGSYEIEGYWMDIGKEEDYNKVNSDIYDLLCMNKE